MMVKPAKDNKYSARELRLLKKRMEAQPVFHESLKAHPTAATITHPDIRKFAPFFKPREADSSTDQIEQETTYQL